MPTWGALSVVGTNFSNKVVDPQERKRSLRIFSILATCSLVLVSVLNFAEVWTLPSSVSLKTLGTNEKNVTNTKVAISTINELVNNNSWFWGVRDELRPLGFQCDVNPAFRDLEDKGVHNDGMGSGGRRNGREGEKDRVTSFLAPFARISKTNNTWELPCTVDEVRVAFTETLSMSPPRHEMMSSDGWRSLLPNEILAEKNESTIMTLNESDSQVWYSCDGDSSGKLLTYSLGVNSDHASQQIKTASHFYSRMPYSEHEPPPSLYILVMDSTSRSSFHRSFPSVVEELRNDDTVDIFEMFRYSSIAWGTSPNTQVLMRGCGLYPGGSNGLGSVPCNETHIPLHLWYAAAGYALLGNYSCDNDHMQFGEMELVIKSNYTYHRLQLDSYVDLVLEQSHYYNRYAPRLPHFFAAHLDDNHGGVNDGFRGQEQSLHRLLDGIDFSNRRSILLIISDHGKYSGVRSSTVLGASEATNPVNIAIVSRGILSESERSTWLNNQQALTTHHDMHATLKSLPLQFALRRDGASSGGSGGGGGDNSIVLPAVKEYCLLNETRGTNRCQKEDTNDKFDESMHSYVNDLGEEGISNSDSKHNERRLPWQTNLMKSVLPSNRTCPDAGTEQYGFCFCGNLAVEGKLSSKQEKMTVKKETIKSLNKWTGNGMTECALYREDDFNIQNVMFYDHGRLKGNVLVSLASNASKASFLVEFNSTLSLIYQRNKYGMFAPKIIRQDRFDDEPCLITYLDGRMPTFKSGAKPNETDLILRWCSCKQTANMGASINR